MERRAPRRLRDAVQEAVGRVGAGAEVPRLDPALCLIIL